MPTVPEARLAIGMVRAAPGVYERMSPPTDPVPSPAAKHEVVDGQAILDRVPVPAGGNWCTHRVPPSVVATTAASPFTTEVMEQVLLDEHAMADNPVVPDGKLWLDHDVPPSVVPMTAAELSTPKQTLLAGQEMWFKKGVPDGREVRLVQVDPPSVVARTSPASPGTSPLPPLAKHTVVDGQEMSDRYSGPNGKVWLFQVIPPSVVAYMIPPPVPSATAKQVVLDGQEMSGNARAPLCDWLVHVVPPSVVAYSTEIAWVLL